MAVAGAERTAPDFDRLSLRELERLLSERQRKFVSFLVSGLSQTAAAEAAGYSRATAASQATRMLKNAKVLAYRRAASREVLNQLCLTPEAIALRMMEIYDRCMAKRPVLEWDSESRSYKECGEWQFDSRGALKVLELLGKNAGMFVERVSVSAAPGGLPGLMEGLLSAQSGE